MIASDVFAKALLQRASAEGIDISNLKLQKLAYYCQGYHLAQYQEPLFDGELKAWPHGPVVKSLYGSYCSFGKETITVPTDRNYIDELSDKAEQVIDFVLMELGRLGAWQLREKSHRETPWLEHFDKESAKVDYEVITHEQLTVFFCGELGRIQDGYLAKHLDSVERESRRVSLPDDVQTADDFYNWIQNI